MQIPERLGEFRLVREVGRGGMGIVYEAVQESLGRRIALKILPGLAAANPQAVERFRREASAAARLSHPGIVQVHETGAAEGLHFIAMEFVDGRDLGTIIRQVWAEPGKGLSDAPMGDTTFHVDFLDDSSGALSSPSDVLGEGPSDRTTRRGHQQLRGLVQLVIKAARAVQAAHEAGIWHRDIKPANLLVTQDQQVKVADFGLARSRDGSEITRTGEVMGTPSYISPEQIAPGKNHVDARTDVYALGVTLYQAIANHLPFEGDSMADLMRQIADKEPPAPRTFNPRIPRDLETICLKALEKDPGRRYQTAQAFADELERYLRDEPILARPAGPVARTWKRVRRHRTISASMGIASVAVAGVFFFASRAGEESLGRRQLEARDLTSRGIVTAILGDTKGAVAQFELALGKDPDSVEALLHRGLEALTDYRIEEAGRDLERARSLAPDSVPVEQTYRTWRWLLGGGDRPTLDIAQLATLDDDLELETLAILYERLGQHLLALDLFQRARKSDPTRVAGVAGSGVCSMYLGRYFDARRDYDVVQGLLPDLPIPALRLVQILALQAGIGDGAFRGEVLLDARRILDGFGKLVERSPMFRLACAAVDSIADDSSGGARRHDPATCMAEALELHLHPPAGTMQPSSGVFLELLSWVEKDLDPEASERHATEALVLRPRSRFASLALGYVAAGRGMKEQSVNHYRHALEELPDCPLAIGPLLELEASANAPGVLDLEERVALARHLMTVLPDDPAVMAAAALTLEQAGDRPAAVAAARLAAQRAERVGLPSSRADRRREIERLTGARLTR